MRPRHARERSFDISAALEMTGGDTALLKELAELFIEEYPKALQALRLAIAENNSKQVEMAAHKLKGSTSGFGAREAVEKALCIEKQGRQGDLCGVEGALQDLEEAFEPLIDELGEYAKTDR